jgi:hypothetical protein
MRVNIYAEEITQRVELVKKGEFTGIRFYLELPVALQTPPTKLGEQPGITHLSGPFVHHHNDDDSAAVTFWGKRELRSALIKAMALLDTPEYFLRPSQENGQPGQSVSVEHAGKLSNETKRD